MTESEATKASDKDVLTIPETSSTSESGGVEQQGSDGSTPAAQSPESTAGEVIKLGGVDTYVSKPDGKPASPARLLLLLTSGTGIRSPHNQLQADHFANEGYLVVMPDLFNGDPAPRGTNPIKEEEILGDARPASSSAAPIQPSLLDTFKIKTAEAAKSFLMDMWLARHTSETVMPILRRVITACQDEFADAVTAGGGIYSTGYCFGARYVLLLAAERPLQPAGGGGILPWMSGTQASSGDGGASGPTTEGPFIKVGALAHPTLVSKHDFDGLKAPVSVVAVEDDPVFPDEIRSAGEDYMTKNGVEHEVQVYPRMPHGFAIVGEYDDETIKVAQATAHQQMLKWLREH